MTPKKGVPSIIRDPYLEIYSREEKWISECAINHVFPKEL